MADLAEIVERGSRLFNEKKTEELLDLYTPDAELIAPGGMTFKGREEIRRFVEGWYQGFPDSKVRTVKRIVAGSTVVEEGIFTGTHTGNFPTPMGDIPPTGRSVEGNFVDIYEFDGDKVKSDRLTFDRMQLMEQLGLVPSPAAAGASN